jgi:hypothetical protein
VPDFDTQTRREPNEPSKLQLRIQSIADGLQWWMPIAAGLLFVIAVGLFVYYQNRVAGYEVICGDHFLGKTGTCGPPASGEGIMICKIPPDEPIPDGPEGEEGYIGPIDEGRPCRRPRFGQPL